MGRALLDLLIAFDEGSILISPKILLVVELGSSDPDAMLDPKCEATDPDGLNSGASTLKVGELKLNLFVEDRVNVVVDG